jgi:hypothetical protein
MTRLVGQLVDQQIADRLFLVSERYLSGSAVVVELNSAGPETIENARAGFKSAPALNVRPIHRE